MNKRAQFFIIAALVVSSIILGTSAIRNQAKAEVVETATVDLSQEISYEAHQVLDNGAFTAQNTSQIQTQMKDLVAAYGASNPDSDIQIVFGKPENLQQIVYDTSTGSKVEPIESSDATLANQGQTTGTEGTSENPALDKVRIRINLPGEKRTVERELSLTRGQNVYIIVKKKIRNDQTVAIKS